jgi:hypothetical protein
LPKDELYEQATECIDNLVKEVLETCEEVAERNNYEKAWVLDMFREKFNKAKRVYE